MHGRASFEELRARAYELADTGRLSSWRQIAGELEVEGFEDADRRLGADPILTSLLNARCKQAQDRQG